MPLSDSLKGIKAPDTVVQKGEQGQPVLRPDNGICATLVCRWIKYKFIGKDFWSNSGNQRTPKWKLTGDVKMPDVAYRAKKAVQHQTYMKAKEATDEITGYRLVGQSPPGRTPWKKNIKNRKIMAAGIKDIVWKRVNTSGWQPKEFGKKLCEVGVGHKGYCASIGIAPAGVSTGHALGAYLDKDSDALFFYDPNLGEIRFDNAARFNTWWQDSFYPSWKTVQPYKSFMADAIFDLTWIAGLQELLKHRADITYERVVGFVDPFAIPDFGDSSPESSPVTPRKYSRRSARSLDVSLDDSSDGIWIPAPEDLE